MRMTYACVWDRKWPAVALVVIVLVFLGFSLPPYVTGDTRVPATFALHYPLLVGHVMFASVAMVCAVAQIWPGLRRRRPVLHRNVGRVYVFSAIPAAVFFNAFTSKVKVLGAMVDDFALEFLNIVERNFT